MSRHFFPTLRAASLAALPALLLTLSAACSDESDATGPLPAREIDASEADLGALPADPILDIVSAATEAWAAKDAAAYAALYATDVRAINPLGALTVGREAFRAQHEFLFTNPFAGSSLTLVVRDIQFLTGTIAIVYLETALTGYAFLPPGLPSSGGVQRNRSTWVVEKRGGEWQIAFQQYTPQL